MYVHTHMSVRRNNVLYKLVEYEYQLYHVCRDYLSMSMSINIETIYVIVYVCMSINYTMRVILLY